MKTVIWDQLSQAQREEILTRPAVSSKLDIKGIVTDIVQRIKTEKDKALLEISARLDHVADGRLKLSQEEIREKIGRVSEELKQALNHAYHNIALFHENQRHHPVTVHTEAGVTCELHTHAIDNVGLYVPGGSAPLVSTVLMLGVPAQIAGCKKVVLCSPPPIADEIVYAASLCGISEIYGIGGAQAIAAMAYGTETVSKVDKIFGPGNAFVTEAKKQISGDSRGAAIDMPAGPSEVLVIADASANPAFVAADLLSQAEHGPDSQVILVTDSADLAARVNEEIDRQLALLPRKDIASRSLDASRAIVCSDLKEACAISNTYAPEHLILQVTGARSLLHELRNAGSIFIGSWTPEAVGDYASGTNHTLPTYGYARTYSSLGLADFERRYTVQELTREALGHLEDTIVKMTDAEGLMAHQRAVTIRLGHFKGE
ncbi:MAG: histidinol dehydrogenase [Succinivibrionaceae bacterium]|nr:histidinol dehydrogenase [Succinivibrionaceae bacterium]